jgi:hypothetical protein
MTMHRRSHDMSERILEGLDFEERHLLVESAQTGEAKTSGNFTRRGVTAVPRGGCGVNTTSAAQEPSRQ